MSEPHTQWVKAPRVFTVGREYEAGFVVDPAERNHGAIGDHPRPVGKRVAESQAQINVTMAGGWLLHVLRRIDLKGPEDTASITESEETIVF